MSPRFSFTVSPTFSRLLVGAALVLGAFAAQTQAIQDKMKEKSKPVIEKYTKVFGEPLVNELYAALDKARAQK